MEPGTATWNFVVTPTVTSWVAALTKWSWKRRPVLAGTATPIPDGRSMTLSGTWAPKTLPWNSLPEQSSMPPSLMPSTKKTIMWCTPAGMWASKRSMSTAPPPNGLAKFWHL
jgi:hypothetical protein